MNYSINLAERLLKTLRDIHNFVDPGKIDLHDAEHLCNMKLVEAPHGTDYRLTQKGREVLQGKS